MRTTAMTSDVDTRAVLSTLWIVVMLNITARDIHELLRPGYLQEVMTGSVNGNEMTEGLLLVGGIGIALHIAMILASRVLPRRINRPLNLVAAPLAITTIIVFTATGGPDLDDLFFTVVEVAALLGVVWSAWRWHDDVVDHLEVDALAR
jgi:divalent metal cation (Fe/Co/Zn/Cd) transporter